MLYNAVGIYVLVVSLLSAFVIVLVARQGRTHKDVSFWLASGLIGILLAVARLSPDQLARLWKGVLVLAFLQFPVIVFQHVFVASRRAASAARAR